MAAEDGLAQNSPEHEDYGVGVGDKATNRSTSTTTTAGAAKEATGVLNSAEDKSVPWGAVDDDVLDEDDEYYDDEEFEAESVDNNAHEGGEDEEGELRQKQAEVKLDYVRTP